MTGPRKIEVESLRREGPLVNPSDFSRERESSFLCREKSGVYVYG